ncbi:GNAT family N-acetyltransferase [Oceanibaculum pacificum]|uniref:GNAT family N-acetyltransferase n=1 Tax=Oceanibaculum pacificum TaxID=580166 RepID=UPI0018DC81F4|nr:GNAT family N-acetyltransferase [Oceanibaculum pacificum]
MLRSARTDECAALSELVMRSKAHWGYSAAFLESCREELAVTPARLAAQPCRVLERDGRPVGLWALDLSGAVPEVALMFADPAVLGGGVGRILWQDMMGEARRLGHARLRLDADPNAEPFYERMGCRRIGGHASPSTGRLLKRYEADTADVLRTRRLTLRCYAPGEAEALYPILSDPLTMRFWPAPFDREKVAGWVARWRETYRSHGYGRWALIETATGARIGDAGLIPTVLMAQDVVDLGYIIHHPYWRQGFAVEAAAAIRDYAFQVLGLPRLVANMAHDHAGSARVAEKIGMTKVAEFDNPRNRGIRTLFWEITA